MQKHLNTCTGCPRQCRVDRKSGRAGFCGMNAGIKISHAGLHFGEEPPISGSNGSGAIFFAGCNLRCVFCQNFQVSQEFRQGRTRDLTVEELAEEALRLQDAGAHNINFVSPSHLIFQMAEAIVTARSRGLVIPVVYNSNGYDAVAALRRIRGLIDIYLPDIKYMDNRLGKRYSGVDDYADIIPAVLEEMRQQVGDLETDRHGIARRGLLVRHLVLPGCPDNSRKCLRLLAGLSPDIHLSIMSQYSPQYKAAAYPEINRTLTAAEYDEITDYALELGLENGFVQDLSSRDCQLPDFDLANPFA
ncbi:radical activating enzyme [hydrothermal vent metagenome]|uniref:Radical activating enzyme n=1 Tax=hydrothermal vent metagenome TaxID=652676 RepID=A0A3B0VHX9_9ZZZZ